MPTTFNVDTLTAAQKTAASDVQTLAASTFAGFEKLVALNLNVVRSALAQTSPDMLSAFSAKTPSDALAAQAAIGKQLAEQAVAYSRSVYAIAADVSTALNNVVEARAASGQKQMEATIEDLLKSAPAGSEPIVAAYQSAWKATQNAIAVAKSSTLKAVELADKQTRQLTDNAMSVVKTHSRFK